MSKEITDCFGNVLISHELYIDVQDPITENTRKLFKANVIALQNLGETTAHINKNWDIPPGKIEIFGSQTDPNIFNQEIDISFTGAGVSNLQLLFIHLRIT